MARRVRTYSNGHGLPICFEIGSGAGGSRMWERFGCVTYAHCRSTHTLARESETKRAGGPAVSNDL